MKRRNMAYAVLAGMMIFTGCSRAERMPMAENEEQELVQSGENVEEESTTEVIAEETEQIETEAEIERTQSSPYTVYIVDQDGRVIPVTETITVDDGYWKEDKNNILRRYDKEGKEIPLCDVWETNEYGEQVYFNDIGQQKAHLNAEGEEEYYYYLPLAFRKMSEEQLEEYRELQKYGDSHYVYFPYRLHLLVGMQPLEKRLTFEQVDKWLKENDGDLDKVFRLIKEYQKFPDIAFGSGSGFGQYYLDEQGDEVIEICYSCDYELDKEICIGLVYDKREHQEGRKDWDYYTGFGEENRLIWDKDAKDWRKLQ